MIDAKILATYSKDEGGSPLEVFGIWIPRKGDNCRFTIEVVSNYATDFTAEIYQKNYEDVGDGTTASVSVNFDQATGRQTMELLGAEELVRFQLTLVRGGDLKPEDVGIVMFRFLQPVWFEAVKV